MWPWMPCTVSRPDSEPRRPILIVSPRVSWLLGSPITHQSMRSPRDARVSTTRRVPSIDGPSSSLVSRKASEPRWCRVTRDESLCRDHHRRETALHVRRAAAIQPSIADLWREGIRGPVLEGSGGNHVRVPREAQHRCLPAASRPEVLDWPEGEPFVAEARRRKSAADHVQATLILRAHGGSADELEGQFDGF